MRVLEREDTSVVVVPPPAHFAPALLQLPQGLRKSMLLKRVEELGKEERSLGWVNPRLSSLRSPEGRARRDFVVK